MYTDEDLDSAVKKQIFSKSAVAEFRKSLSAKDTIAAHEESFKLITGFNDIFIVVICSLLLFSSFWLIGSINHTLALFVLVLSSWGLAEFFVLKKKMALPAIVLLLFFVSGVFALCFSFFSPKDSVDIFTAYANLTYAPIAIILSSALSAVAAYAHWRRFKVPITVSAGVISLVMLFIATIAHNYLDFLKSWYLLILFFCGIAIFILAMYWDYADRDRVTFKSDVSFWLHVASAPFIVHSVFSSIGAFNGNNSLSNILIVIALYLVIAFISVVINRRVFMLSSLIYVMYAINSAIEQYSAIDYSMSLTGVVVGLVLLCLSVYWTKIRLSLLVILPEQVRKYLPS